MRKIYVQFFCKVFFCLMIGLVVATAAFAAEGAKPSRLVIASGNSAGTYYYVATGMGKIITDKVSGVECTVEATSGSPLENLNFVNKAVDTLGIANYDALIKAINGDKAAGYRAPLDNLRVIMAGHTQIGYVVALSNGPVKSFPDMKGQKLGTLTKGASLRSQLEAILAEYGFTEDNKDFTLVPMAYTEQMDALKDGNLQVLTCGGGIPQAAILDLSSTNAITLIDIPKEIQEKMIVKYPYWPFRIIPAGTYKDQDKDVSVITVQTLLLGQADLDEDYVANLVKTIFDNNAEMVAIHPEGANWGKESSLRLLAERPELPWHPGSLKVLKELQNK
jgi:TRAP transporter TAXI family solute receptor